MHTPNSMPTTDKQDHLCGAESRSGEALGVRGDTLVNFRNAVWAFNCSVDTTASEWNIQTTTRSYTDGGSYRNDIGT